METHNNAVTKYRTIVADPPWTYDSWPGVMGPNSRWKPDGPRDNRRKPIDFPTLTVDEIAALPVRDLADPSGCHVYLWTTQRYLRDAFDVMATWGVRTRPTTCIWCKEPMGLGPGGTFVSSAEFFLFGRIGTLRHLERVDTVWFRWPRTTVHSKKPEAFLDMVERVSPAPRLEMFARRDRLGWETYGDESLGTCVA